MYKICYIVYTRVCALNCVALKGVGRGQAAPRRRPKRRCCQCYCQQLRKSGYIRRPGTETRHHFPFALKQRNLVISLNDSLQPNFKMSIAGKYTFESQDNFGAFLEAMGELAPQPNIALEKLPYNLKLRISPYSKMFYVLNNLNTLTYKSEIICDKVAI